MGNVFEPCERLLWLAMLVTAARASAPKEGGVLVRGSRRFQKKKKKATGRKAFVLLARTRFRFPQQKFAAKLRATKASASASATFPRRSNNMVLSPLTNTLSQFVSGVFNIGMAPPRFLGRLARGISRAVQAHATAKRELSGPINNLWLVVGLGNPGNKYDETRHNIGFRAVDEIARSNGIPMSKVKEKAQVGLGSIAGESIMLVKPLTFMNLSGESVGKLSRYYKVPRERVLVIYDDLDLPNAQVKLKLRGGHGGHNGMRSIIEHFSGKSDFPRLRIGIGRPANGRIPIVKHVLQRFSKEEQDEIDFAVQDCVSIVEKIMLDGMQKALSTCNNKKKKTRPIQEDNEDAFEQAPAAAEAK